MEKLTIRRNSSQKILKEKEKQGRQVMWEAKNCVAPNVARSKEFCGGTHIMRNKLI
jgi:hypothetical protein